MTDPTPQTPTRDEAVRGQLPIWLEGGIAARLSAAMHAHLKEYVYSPDEGADHEPTDFERWIMEDMLNGALSGQAVNAILQEAAFAMLASAPAPASGEVDAVAGLSRADICRLWQWAAVNKPSSMTVEGFTDLLLNEIDGRSDPAKVQSITAQYLDCLYFADNCLSSNGLFAQAKQLRDRIASLSPAATPVSEAGGERDLVADLAAVVRVQNGNRHDDINALLARADAALAKPASSPAGPGHTDLMVTPESLDAFLSDNSPPDMLASSGPSSPAGGDVREALVRAVKRAMENAGTLSAKEAVKLVPADWHRVCDLVLGASRSTSAGRVGE